MDRLLRVFFRLLAVRAILPHSILSLLACAILHLLGLARLLNFGSRACGGTGGSAGEAAAAQQCGAGYI
jgi:hypothetical protein